MRRLRAWIVKDHDLAFAILLAACVYAYFGFTNELFRGRTERHSRSWSASPFWALSALPLRYAS